MLYLFDEDKNNAIIEIYDCRFVSDGSYSSRLIYFKNEEDITIDIKKLSQSDIICFHNSFPDFRTKIINRINFWHEENPQFYLIAFSGENSFFNTFHENRVIRIHKNKFYLNLKCFLDSEFEINKLLFGESDQKNEAEIIFKKMNDVLFYRRADDRIDLKDFKPKDLKRFCELTSYSYSEFLQQLEGKTVSQLKSLINLLINNI